MDSKVDFMKLVNEVKKEIDRIDKIMKNLEVIDSKADGLVKVLNSYYEDSKSFFEKKEYLQALETAFIVWAYRLNPALILKS